MNMGAGGAEEKRRHSMMDDAQGVARELECERGRAAECLRPSEYGYEGQHLRMVCREP